MHRDHASALGLTLARMLCIVIAGDRTVSPKIEEIMTKWSLLALLVLALPARGQVDLLHESRLGQLYVSASPNRYVQRIDSVPNEVPIDLYLVADVDFGGLDRVEQNNFNGIQAWEVQVTLPPYVFALSATLLPQTSINVGTSQGNVYDFFVGTGSLVPAGEPQPLVHFRILVPGAIHTYVTVGPVSRPSYAGEAVWVESVAANGCSIDGRAEPCVFRFEDLGALLLNNYLAEEVESFSAMKARF